jgi:hydrogenase nickel incorporation protein HypB
MCTVCGCDSTINNDHRNDVSTSSVVSAHDHHHDHHNGKDHHYGQGEAGVTVAGFSQSKLVQIERNILSKNDGYAEHNRQWFGSKSLLALNLVSSPGAGKTTLLVETLKSLKYEIPIAVIEGDQETANDADRIRQIGVPAIQINTGKGCHLDAHMVGHALQELSLAVGGVVLIENVGNLVCPAAFDLGEASKVVILSVTEGEDKPIKYPDMFAVADLLIISKIDLLPHVDFDVDQAVEYARRVNPDIEVLKLSAKTGEGLQDWKKWIITRTTSVAVEPLSVSSIESNHSHA